MSTPKAHQNEQDSPAVYVGTYGKYNSGSIAGAWLYLEAYADKEDFLAACSELHKDEHDPEFMFQDFQCFPRSYYGESSIKDELWDWLALDEDDRELLAVYQEHVRDEADIDEAREAFQGKADTKADWAEQFIEDCGMLQDVPDSLARYFDYEAYARDCEMGGDITFVRHDGELWVFNNH